MNDYLNVFVDRTYPNFLDKYTKTKTLERIKHVTQYCGSDYTTLYNPRFLLTRFDHSLIVAHMTWHFTHDKAATVSALLHDSATPCFAHAIDHMMNDRIRQETSERDVASFIENDEELLNCLKIDNLSLADVTNFSNYPILENKSPKLCTDRLDGVLHTTYVWLNMQSLEDIEKVYDDLLVLENEDGYPEIGFKSLDVALKFVHMVRTYALELQGNRDKFVTEYVAMIVKKAISAGLFTVDDLYTMKEEDIVDTLASSFDSWNVFKHATEVVGSSHEPEGFYVSIETKKRNVVPLVKTENGAKRVDAISDEARKIYEEILSYKDAPYAVVDGLGRL